MTTKTTMPGPVAWVRRQDAVISTVRKQSGAWLPMVTTTQAEAYANKRVKQVLEEVAEMADDVFAFSVGDSIRALIPDTK